MNKIKNGIVSGTALAWGLLGISATSAWADDQPPAGEPPARRIRVNREQAYASEPRLPTTERI